MANLGTATRIAVGLTVLGFAAKLGEADDLTSGFQGVKATLPGSCQAAT